MEHAQPPFRIKDWCELARKSEPSLYKAWREGRGPRSIRDGRSRVILETPMAYYERLAAEAGIKPRP